MTNRTEQDLASYCSIVEDNLAEVVAELREVDLADLVSFIRFESYPTIDDLVNAATELFFNPDMLVFSWAACADLRWDALPAVTLGLEFRHPSVTVFFDLTLRDAAQSVDVLGIAFDAPALPPHAALSHAFAEARLRDGAGPPLALVRHRRTRLRRP